MVGTGKLTVDELFNQGFDAIFIGTGNALSKSLPIDGAKLKGVIQATYFLQMVELSNSNSVDPNEVPIKEGDEVVVIGGGNTAMDAARTAMRCGAKSVKVVNRRREEDMAALKSEIDAAKEVRRRNTRFKRTCRNHRRRCSNRYKNVQYVNLMKH